MNFSIARTNHANITIYGFYVHNHILAIVKIHSIHVNTEHGPPRKRCPIELPFYRSDGNAMPCSMRQVLNVVLPNNYYHGFKNVEILSENENHYEIAVRNL